MAATPTLVIGLIWTVGGWSCDGAGAGIAMAEASTAKRMAVVRIVGVDRRGVLEAEISLEPVLWRMICLRSEGMLALIDKTSSVVSAGLNSALPT